METVTASRVERAELPGMIATLCSYEGLFGPYHPHTLGFTVSVAEAHRQHGELGKAKCLLERAVRDLTRHLDREHELRPRAIVALRDLFIQQGDYEKAGALQKEFLECQVQRLGADHPDTIAARVDLTRILLNPEERNI